MDLACRLLSQAPSPLPLYLQKIERSDGRGQRCLSKTANLMPENHWDTTLYRNLCTEVQRHPILVLHGPSHLVWAGSWNECSKSLAMFPTCRWKVPDLSISINVATFSISFRI